MKPQEQIDKLTPKQIANWRKVLVVTIGPYALLAPDIEIQRIRDQIQSKFGNEIDASNPTRQESNTATH